MSVGGGDSPSGTTFQTQFTRDAPQIEAAKMGLMGTAQQYARFGQNPWELSTPGAKIGDPEFLLIVVLSLLVTLRIESYQHYIPDVV